MPDKNRKYLIIGISGMSGAGKSTLVKALKKQIEKIYSYLKMMR